MELAVQNNMIVFAYTHPLYPNIVEEAPYKTKS
jgi:hypothetical protein